MDGNNVAGYLQWAIRSEAPVKWRTFRDCKGWDGRCSRMRLFNIQSDPCESRAAGEEGGRGNAPLESPAEVRITVAPGVA